MGKLSALATCIFLGLALLSFIPEISNIQNSLDNTFGNYLSLVFFIGIILGYVIFNFLGVMFTIKAVDYLSQRIRRKALSVKISEDSQSYLGGVLRFDVQFSGFFSNGYFVINIKSPYWEGETTKIRYYPDKDRGDLNDYYKDKNIKLKCHIPENFDSGEYDITISIVDVIFWISSLKTKRIVISKKLKTMIEKSEN